ncbi:hypothetical protein GBA65_12665 [Rubrobacter marinus]|uniref:Uncharacterized protein n=1 Tax=Rubrobacter marinus TaxID=2653852 RepID=A0A6G8PYE6_9ACTN|nr:hypothetical protein [Rubrobacter marinus]QIN79231.1 hypothetical protein GBA65_12665 [Rubrobacter marinus]
MKFESVEQEIGMTVDWCVILWGANGIPVERVAEMKGELEDHLRAAVRDGKSVDSVIAGDVSEFAAAWAIEDRPPMTPAARLLERGWLLAASMIFVSVFGHLWYFSLNYVVEAWWYSMPLFFAASASLFEVPGVPREHEESPPVRMLVSVSLGLLAGVAMAGINVAVHLGDALFEWSWISTLIVVLLGAPLLKNRRRTDVLPILEEREGLEPGGPSDGSPTGQPE